MSESNFEHIKFLSEPSTVLFFFFLFVWLSRSLSSFLFELHFQTSLSQLLKGNLRHAFLSILNPTHPLLQLMLRLQERRLRGDEGGNLGIADATISEQSTVLFYGVSRRGKGEPIAGEGQVTAQTYLHFLYIPSSSWLCSLQNLQFLQCDGESFLHTSLLRVDKVIFYPCTGNWTESTLL